MPATRAQLDALVEGGISPASAQEIVSAFQLDTVSSMLAEAWNPSAITTAALMALMDFPAVDARMAANDAVYKRLEFDECLRYPALYFDPSLVSEPGTADGSPGNPYRDLTAARLKPGYRHLIKRGTTITTGAGTWLTTPAGATPTAPIILGTYGDAYAALPVINGAASTMVIRHGTNSKNIRIRDLDIIGPQAGAAGTARLAISTNISGSADTEARLSYNNLIERCRVRTVTTDGGGATDCNAIKLYGADNAVRHCEIRDIATDGLWFHGDRMLVEGNLIMRVATDGRIAGDCVQAGGQSDNAVIRSNILDHRSADGKQCIYFEAVGGAGTESKDVLIEGNTCYGFDGTANNHTPIFALGIRCVVRCNLVTGGQTGIRIGPNGICTRNVVIATVGNGISALDNDALIAFNAVVQTGTQNSQTLSCGIRAGSSAGVRNVARNNVIIGFYNGVYAVTSAVDGQPTISESHNAFGIQGVSNAYYRLNGDVIAPHSTSIIVAYATALADLGLDANYRPSGQTLAVIADVGLGNDADKDGRTSGQAVRGAYRLAA